jgi:hypothetical protein
MKIKDVTEKAILDLIIIDPENKQSRHHDTSTWNSNTDTGIVTYNLRVFQSMDI